VKKVLSILILTATAYSFFSCSTELDINGNKKEVMVVYGILDAASSTQYIKINRAFLGEGNALEYAQIPDSTLYPYLLDVKLDVVNSNGQSVLSTPLTADTVNVYKDGGGVFFSGYQTYYRFDFKSNIAALATINTFTNDTTWLKSDYRYKLIIIDNVTGNIYESEAPGLSNILIETPPSSSTTISFYTDNQSNVKFSSVKNGKIYEGKFTFHYYEIYDSNPTDTIEKTIDWNLATVKSDNTSGGELLYMNYSNWTFYDLLGQAIEQRDDVQRYTGYVFLSITIGAEDLNTYMDVNQPSNTLIQDKPSFSNISNGIGLFTSRYSYRRSRPMKLNTNTKDLLKTHPSTENLNFIGELPNLP
jgi:hypothetical protein